MLSIQKVAVLGAGVMGSGIAAHLANCGIPVLLLDVVPPDLNKILKAKPAHLYDADDIHLITPGLLDENLAKLKECDWVIEAAPEKIEIKKELYKKVAPHLKKEAWFSSNTSGLPMKDLKFRDKFCITHFFNPPRYLKLVEVVGEAPELAKFVEEKLGKGVVMAKDTPNFIANRIGIFALYDAFHLAVQNNWPVEKIEAVCGPATLRPKSALFRLCDVVGLDTISFVAEASHKLLTHDEQRERFKNPDFLSKMIQNGWIGQKAKQGFYKKTGPEEILVLDLKTLEYRKQEKFKTPSLGKVRELEDPAEKLRTVVFADDEAGQIAWALISNVLVYAANRIPEIADTPEEIDRALRWGFGWEMGPFEMWNSLGVEKVCERLKKEGRQIPKLFQGNGLKGVGLKSNPFSKIIEKNDGASLVDLGDGVFCVEFHTKMNAVDEDILTMLQRGVEYTEKNGAGMVITNDAVNFCVGANLMLILIAAQQKEWEQINHVIGEFQVAVQKIRFSKKPVVAAPFGFTFGGGCEFCLASHHIEAAAETYIGLVEVGVGVLPAGGGCKNMILNWEEKLREAHNPKDKIWFSSDDGGVFPKVQKAFETIAMAKVGSSAKEAKKIGYLRSRDSFTIDREKLTAVAKAKVLAMTKGFEPPKLRDKIQLPGRGGEMALINGADPFLKKGMISEYDLEIAKTIAHVLSGGNRPSVHFATEQDLLDLEREAFLKLCGQEKSLDRIRHMLTTGKPLRN